MIQIDLRNNCFGAPCCIKKTCTPFSSGKLSSIDLYGYGTYRFRAVFGKSNTWLHHYKKKDVNSGFLSCIFLESDSKNQLKLSICICNRDHTVAIMTVITKNFMDVKRAELYFD